MKRGPIKIRAILENDKRRKGAYFLRTGPRFGAYLPGTPTYARFTRRAFWYTSWFGAIREVNEKMKRK